MKIAYILLFLSCTLFVSTNSFIFLNEDVGLTTDVLLVGVVFGVDGMVLCLENNNISLRFCEFYLQIKFVSVFSQIAMRMKCHS